MASPPQFSVLRQGQFQQPRSGFQSPLGGAATSGLRSPFHRAPTQTQVAPGPGDIPRSPTPQDPSTVRRLAQQAGGLRFSPRQFNFREDPRINDLIDRLAGESGGVDITTQEDPRFSALIEQLTGQIGEQQGRIEEALAGLQAPAAGEQALRDRIASLQSGQGIGPIDVQSDAEAAAFRVAREREARRARSELAERASATGDINTGQFGVDLSQLRNQAGFDVASNEARLANERRQEVLAQMLSGANLGLSDIAQQRQAQQAAINALRGDLQGQQSSLFEAFARANADRARQAQEQQAARQLALSGAGSAIGALVGQQGERRAAFETNQAQRQFGFGANRQAILDQLATEQGLLGRDDALAQQGFQNELQGLGLGSDLASAAVNRNATRAQTAGAIAGLPRNSLGRRPGVFQESTGVRRPRFGGGF